VGEPDRQYPAGCANKANNYQSIKYLKPHVSSTGVSMVFEMHEKRPQ
jgi:hypothetical protein